MRGGLGAAWGGVMIIAVLGCGGIEDPSQKIEDAAKKGIERAVEEAGEEFEKKLRAAEEGEDSPSRKACLEYIKYLNSLPCYQNMKVDPEKRCLSILNMAGDRQVEKYTCMRKLAGCDGKIPKKVDYSKCMKR